MEGGVFVIKVQGCYQSEKLHASQAPTDHLVLINCIFLQLHMVHVSSLSSHARVLVRQIKCTQKNIKLIGTHFCKGPMASDVGCLSQFVEVDP